MIGAARFLAGLMSALLLTAACTSDRPKPTVATPTAAPSPPPADMGDSATRAACEQVALAATRWQRRDWLGSVRAMDEAGKRAQRAPQGTLLAVREFWKGPSTEQELRDYAGDGQSSGEELDRLTTACGLPYSTDEPAPAFPASYPAWGPLAACPSRDHLQVITVNAHLPALRSMSAMWRSPAASRALSDVAFWPEISGYGIRTPQPSTYTARGTRVLRFQDSRYARLVADVCGLPPADLLAIAACSDGRRTCSPALTEEWLFIARAGKPLLVMQG